MTNAQMKLGCLLLMAQLVILAMTYGFNGMLDRQAAQDGLTEIINGGK